MEYANLAHWHVFWKKIKNSQGWIFTVATQVTDIPFRLAFLVN